MNFLRKEGLTFQMLADDSLEMRALFSLRNYMNDIGMLSAAVLIGALRGPFYTREITYVSSCSFTYKLISFKKGSTLKGKNLLPR